MPAVRRQINIAASPRTVWRSLTTPDGLAAWLVDSGTVQPQEGGRVVLTLEGDDGEPVEIRGMIHTWRPTSHLEIAFDRGKNEYAGSRVAFKLARDGEETQLTMVHSGGEALEDEARRAAIDTTWRQALNALQSTLEG